MQKKIVLGLLLTTIMLTTALLSVPVTAKDWNSTETGERQIVAYGMLHDELFPEYNYTRWQRRSINVGFTAYGEMVTDQDPFNTGSKYGVGLTYPTDSAWQVDMPAGDDGTDYGIYPCEHISTPARSGAEWEYFPIEGWQLYWKFHEGTPSFAVDPWWHVSMAIYGNHSSPYGRARLDVVPVSMTVITNTSRLFVAQVVVRTDNETLKTSFGFEPKLFEITATYVFFKNTKKVASYWQIEYLKTEYGPVDVVFRRMTDFDIDQKFQEGEDEGFAVFYPNSKRDSWKITGTITPTFEDNHMFWTGCEYWPQNYSLAVVWTNSSIGHWVPPDGYSEPPQHHAAFVAYYPNCSNWDTDNWNHYTYNLHRPTQPAWLFFGEGLGRRFGTQPVSVEYRSIDADHYTAANLLLGQWNITLSSSTAFKKAKFLTLYGITNCSDTFGYDNDPSSYDWDSAASKTGQITAGELKYMLSEYFNASYKLSTESVDNAGLHLDLSNWYPFSGVTWSGLTETWGNTFVNHKIQGEDPRNTTFIIGDSNVHYDTVTMQGAATIDVVGAVMAGEAFGSYIDLSAPWACPTDPWWLAMYDTQVFSPLATAPHYTLTKNSLVYPDPVPVTLKLTGWQRMQGRMNNQGNLATDIFSTPTCYTWDVNHTIDIGGPRVNLGTAYFNEHSWIIWVDPATTGSELPEAGFFSIPTGTFYPESEGGWSLIAICEDLNLTSWTSVYDNAWLPDLTHYDTNAHSADPGLDGPTLNDPYAGLIVYGVSGVDTHAATYWLAHYWCKFNQLYTNATELKRGVTAILLNTAKMCGVVDHTEADWGDGTHGGEWAIQEIVGPPEGRWRAETGTNWGPWMSYPTSVDWYAETGT